MKSEPKTPLQLRAESMIKDPQYLNDSPREDAENESNLNEEEGRKTVIEEYNARLSH